MIGRVEETHRCAPNLLKDMISSSWRCSSSSFTRVWLVFIPTISKHDPTLFVVGVLLRAESAGKICEWGHWGARSRAGGTGEVMREC